MSYFASGMVTTRIGELHPGLSATARHVLAVMATFTRDRDPVPTCFASRQTVAERANCSVRTVSAALVELKDAGAIRHEGDKVRTEGSAAHKTVRWRLVAVETLRARSALKGEPEGTVQDLHSRDSARSALKGSAESAHDPSDLSGGKPEEREEDREAADAGGSAGAPPPAAAPSMEEPSEDGPGGIVGEVMAARGCTQDSAQRWIERKIAASTTSVRNEVAWIRRCLAKEAEDAATASAGKDTRAARSTTAAKTAKPAKTRKSLKGVPTAKRPGVSRRQRMSPEERAEEQCQAVFAVRSEGAAVEDVAADLGLSVGTVQGWVRYVVSEETIRWRQAMVDAVRSGVPVAQVGKTFDRPPDLVERLVRECDRKRPKIVERAEQGQAVGYIALRLELPIGEVERVLAESVGADRDLTGAVA